MYVPFITPSDQKIYPRKGGGGRGRWGGGGSGGSKGGGGRWSGNKGGSGGIRWPIGKGGANNSKGRSISLPKTSWWTSRTASPYSVGGGRAKTIPHGQPFAGRYSGGGTRDQVYGSQYVNSSFPSHIILIAILGCMEVGIQDTRVEVLMASTSPSYFGPLYGDPALAMAPPICMVITKRYVSYHFQKFKYLINILHMKYGNPNNSSRPGGAMVKATFSSASANSTFFILADNSTVISLIDFVSTNCSSLINNPTSSSVDIIPPPFNSSDPLEPRPESAIQYYRASSVVLLLDGYNNTGALSPSNLTSNSPLPVWVDQPLLNCLNYTIGQSVPLMNPGPGWWQYMSSPVVVMIMWAILYIITLF